MADEIVKEEEKQNDIHEKGFDLYNKIKVGKKVLEDAIINLDNVKIDRYRRFGDPRLGDKRTILKALAENDIDTIRAVSNYFYRTNGIYQKICNYMATLYRYDWFIVPEVYKQDNLDNEKIQAEFVKILNYLDNSYVTKTCGDIALQVILNGCYYGYRIYTKDNMTIQELPVKYCRTRYSVGNRPAVEFNLSYFDIKFPEPKYREKVLKLFPDEFRKAYVAYKKGQLGNDDIGYWEDGLMSNGWYLLDPDCTITFSLSSNAAFTGLPLFVNAVPDLIDLDGMQEINRRKQLQQLARLIVQKLPLDKNGDLIFDVDEASDIHKNAVKMLENVIGADVLTTFTEVSDIDMSTTGQVADNSLENAERAVYNAFGVTKNLFNTDGNLSTEKSILTDAGSIRTLILQYEVFFNDIIQHLNRNPKKYKFKFYMLETTQYNYQELSKMYKEQVQIGYSKMLPQIAMGHSQSSIINAAFFENEVLNLSALMMPPLQSSVMNAEALGIVKGKSVNEDGSGSQVNVEKSSEDNKAAGRPEKPESEKSDKTLANEESKN